MRISAALHMLSPFVVVSVRSFVGESAWSGHENTKLKTTVVSYVDGNKIPTLIHWLVRL